MPDAVWDDVARPGFDAVWLMGVWQRSPMGADIARANDSMRAAHRRALPDLVDADVVGSAYCVRGYRVDARLGGDDGLAVARVGTRPARGAARPRLRAQPRRSRPSRGSTEHPEYFVHGTDDDLARDPSSFLRVGEHIVACGRDPYFPAWPEVLQLDATDPALRAPWPTWWCGSPSAATACAATWRCCCSTTCSAARGATVWATNRRPATTGFWPTVIGAVRRARPDFVMWAEAYWDLEPVLAAAGVRRLLRQAALRPNRAARTRRRGPRPSRGTVDGQRHTVRFVENHDEPRAASLLSADAHLAALTTVLTVPGVALVHEGELDRRHARVPVTLGRRPHEAPDADFRLAASKLLDAVGAGLRAGEWALGDVRGWPDNRSADRLLAWSWTAARCGTWWW